MSDELKTTYTVGYRKCTLTWHKEAPWPRRNLTAEWEPPLPADHELGDFNKQELQQYRDGRDLFLLDVVHPVVGRDKNIIVVE